jgi:hypothetical protein
MRVDINFPFVGHFDAVERPDGLSNSVKDVIHDASFIGRNSSSADSLSENQP